MRAVRVIGYVIRRTLLFVLILIPVLVAALMLLTFLKFLDWVTDDGIQKEMQ